MMNLFESKNIELYNNLYEQLLDLTKGTNIKVEKLVSDSLIQVWEPKKNNWTISIGNGMFHYCGQNTFEVYDKDTYKIIDDVESYIEIEDIIKRVEKLIERNK